MNYAINVKKKLDSIIDEMDSFRWFFIKNPDTDFTQEKKWSFSKVIKFIISAEGKALKDELYE